VAKETVTASWSQAHFAFWGVRPKKFSFWLLALGFVLRRTLISE